MTLRELSEDYRAHATALRERVALLEAGDMPEEAEARLLLCQRIHLLRVMWREAGELAVLTERYYERGYRRNGKYTL